MLSALVLCFCSCFVVQYSTTTVSKVLDRIRSVYCDTVGVEYYHIHDADQREWLQREVRGPAVALRSLFV